MNDYKLSDFDGCECGDYRLQHERGVGRCKMPNDMTHGFRPCTEFRLSGPPATEIPAPYRSEPRRASLMMPESPGVVMDIPSAWKWTEASKMEDHHEQCSWRTHRMLCDCRVLWDEYDRRKALKQGASA